MIRPSYMPEDGEQHLTCEFLRTELQRFEISLVRQLRSETLQYSPSRIQHVPLPAIDDLASLQKLQLIKNPFPKSGGRECKTTRQSQEIEEIVELGQDLADRKAFPLPGQLGPLALPGSMQGTTEEHEGEMLEKSVNKHRGSTDTKGSRELFLPTTLATHSLTPKESHMKSFPSSQKKPSVPTIGSSITPQGARGYMQRGRSRSVYCRPELNEKRRMTEKIKESLWYRYWKKKLKSLQLIGESFIVVCIILNALFYSALTDYMAQNGTENVPGWCLILELLFCIVFTIELIAKLATHRFRFFMMEGRSWNYFDAFLVVISWVDVLLETVANFEIEGGTNQVVKNMAFMRWLRMLRLLRVLRVARLLKFMGDLNVVFSAIQQSLKSLVSTVIILLGILYIFAISFTQICTSRRTDLEADDFAADDLKQWWGSLGRSMLSLIESIFGGVDWNDVIEPLMSINVFLGVVFVAYIGFMLLALLNVITGYVVDAAIQNAKRVKDRAFKHHVRQLFIDCDMDRNGRITKEELNDCIGNDAVAAYMAELGIEYEDVAMLFHYLDDDDSDSIDPEELLVGLARLREGTKFIDIMTLLHEVDFLKTSLTEDMHQMKMAQREIFDELKSYLRTSPSASPNGISYLARD